MSIARSGGSSNRVSSALSIGPLLTSVLTAPRRAAAALFVALMALVPGRRQRTTVGMGALAVMLVAPVLAAPAPTAVALTGTTYVVNTADDNDDTVCDSSHCSLREAINAANANTDQDVITFAIPGTGVRTIVTSGLPAATKAVSIDGSTQPGYAGTPVVEIITASSTGLQLNGAGSLVRGLAIGRSSTLFSGSGLVLAGAGITVEDNHLNLDAAGTTVSTFNVALDVYAGAHRIAGNVIASNNYSMLIRGGGVGTGGNEIVGNLIGTDATGTIGLSNPNSGPGIELRVDGGGNLFHGNVVSSHYVGLTIGGSSNNVITGNFIGTDATGMFDLGNRAAGLSISNYSSGGTTHVPTGNRVGGTTPNDRNIISGNGEPNVVGTGITVGGADNVVLGNYIGTDATGMNPLPNARGVQVQQGTGIVVGGSGAGEGNVISGNYENGLQFSFEAGGSRAQGNLIGVAADGTTPMGNGATGVYIGGLSNGSGVTIGGTAAGDPNLIAHNGTNGAGYPGVLVDSSSRYVSILGNSIRDNDGPGIDLLGGFGITPNDGGAADDADVGGNDLVNFPVLTAVTPGTSSTTVAGNLDTIPNTTFRVEFFSSSACDASGHGEGSTFLGAASVATDGNGEATFSASVTTPAAGSAITATATDSAGSTSEFSACVLDPRSPVAEPGSVTIVKQTDPGGGTGFSFTGPAGANTAGDGSLGQGGDSVAFYRDNQGLFLLDVAAMTETALAGTLGGQDPEFSPDSSMIAFTRSMTLESYDVASGTIDVVVDATHGLFPRHPSWSPSGDWIIFHAGDRLWVVPSDGSQAPTQLTTVQSAFAVWAADGRIAWRSGSSPNVRVATFDEATLSLIGETGLGSLDSQQRAMHWSPDGTQLAAGAAFNSASDTYLYALTDTGTTSWPATQLTSDDDESDKNAYHTDPTWRPDSSEIIFAGRYSGGDYDLYRVAPDGSAEAALFYGGSGTNESGPDWGQASTTSTYTLDHGGSIGGLVPAGESVTFAELPNDGYELQSIVCDSPSAVVDTASGSVTVTPQEGEDVTCTFTNVPSLLDSDGDGVADDMDNCVGTANPDQADLDNDGVGDACDDTIVTVSISDLTVEENPPPNDYAQLVFTFSGPLPAGGACLRFRDIEGSATEPEDYFVNNGRTCFPEGTQNATTGVAIYDDGLPEGPETFQIELYDLEGVAPGNVLATWTITDPAPLDADGDGVPDDTDNCVDTANPDQDDLDGDGVGDVCDGDIDGDGLSNVIEIWLGCDPYNPDSDGDGVWDVVEILIGTNPLLGDTDDDGEGDGGWLLRVYGSLCGCGLGDDSNGNGLWDLVEFYYFGGLYDVDEHGGGGFGSLTEYLFHQCGCSPDELDGDGIPRIVHHVWGNGGLLTYIARCGCHPWEDDGGGGGIRFEFLSLLGGGLDEDPDGDGIITVIEILLGCDPFNDDTDGDGLSDFDEVFVYGTLFDNDDTDGDGMLDGVEIALGCDPHDPDSDGDGVLDGADSAPLAYVHECRIDVTGPIPVGATVTATTDVRGQVTGARLRWGDGGVEILPGVGTATFQYAYDAAGIYLVDCEVTDTTDGTQASEPTYVVVYDPSAGFVTGGGWIDSPAGAYVPDVDAAGPARFGFVSQYKKGATVPTGSTQFQFQAGNLNLHSNEFDWLVVSGARAQFRGTGSVNGVDGYRFTVTVIDGNLISKGGIDRLRMQIWAPGGGLVYDNQMGAANGDDPTTAITQGSIVIHTKGNK